MMWIVGLWIRKAVELFKRSLRGHPNRNMEGSGTEGDVNCGGIAEEASEEKNISIWLRDCSCEQYSGKTENW